MLENINETQTTMQADEVDEVVSKDTSSPLTPTEMTFNDQTSEVKEEPLVDNLHNSENDPLKGINLEDDIEKVEVTSQESSEENEEECGSPKSEREHPIFSIPTQNPSESIKNWLQRITDMQTEIHKKYSTTAAANHASSHTANVNSSSTNTPSTTTSIPPNRVVKYQDLPYMGEITLDNSKPRRGRKPKKADICHLIYKNYGTIFPGTPNPGSYLEKDSKKCAPTAENKEANNEKDSGNRIDVQNKIISSLLEKRLTQEYNRSKEANKRNLAKDPVDQNEPLNLCIRDLNHLKIRLLKNTDNTYTSQIKSEPLSDEESDCHLETPSPGSSSLRLPTATPDSFPPPSPDGIKLPDGATGPGGYVYWPNAGVFIHPVALQQQLMMYQRMTNGTGYVLPGNHSPKPTTEVGAKAEPSGGVELRKLVPKMPKPRPIFSKENIEQTDQQGLLPHDMKKRNGSSLEAKIPVKRKRSAIFIPPIPTENNTNPATEVSICKFKFTGGAKPSLQEKKMLSVDSGGNFRYYSGTGDKSMRGYEFFPRETLQQQITNTQGSSTGAFLQASGEKIYPVPPPGFAGGTKNGADFLLSPNIPVPGFSKSQDNRAPVPDSTQKIKKRKSRKSLQREKLEQTFKEKGFLIQTQQTESAEGATYCKFRQLRKFTRYLFRSWKDYLPGNITEGEQPVIANADGNGEMNINQLSRDSGDSLSRHSSELTASNAQ